MNSAKPILLSWLFVSLICVGVVLAQQPSTATVAGRVRVEGGALAGIQVMLYQERERADVLNQAPPLTTVTDADGNYRLSNVPAGKYRLRVHAPVYVNEQEDEAARNGRAVNVAEGETIENLNFTLRRGGVITGKVTDEEGRPLIEELIRLTRVDAQGKKLNDAVPSMLGLPHNTDDRGVYRLFGLAPGRYLVAAGLEPNTPTMFGLSKEFQKTYHPRTTNEAEAKIIEVGAGAEVEGIDIMMLRASGKKGFTVSGRVLEAETGKPVTGVMLAYGSKESPFGMTPATTNSQGEFHLDGLQSGSYTISVLNMVQAMMGSGSEFYAEPLKVEVRSGDVSGLELKMSKGAVLSGRVALDGAPDPKLAAKLVGTMVHATLVKDSSKGGSDPADMLALMSGTATGVANQDGTFRLSGLRPGNYNLGAESLQEKTLRTLRVEQNGVKVEQVEVTGTTPVTDVRIVVASGTASIVGRVEMRGGSLPAGTNLSVFAMGKDATTGSLRATARVDARGQFNFEGLIPGVYELSVRPIKMPDSKLLEFENAKQTVSLADKARQEIVLVVELNPKEKDR